MNLVFKKFEKEDVNILTPIMYRAFNEDSRIHLNKEKGGPDGYDDGSFLRKWFLDPHASAFVVYDGEIPIGGVNLWINRNNENFLGCLFVDAAYENKGYGKEIWKKCEELFPNTAIWRTETPGFSRRNHYFYINKCGFHCVRIENPKNLVEANYLFEKKMK